jgi:hypothetical protein
MIFNGLENHLQNNDFDLWILIKKRVLLDVVGTLELNVDSNKLQLKLILFYEAHVVANIV